jgi:nucleoside-diphosphate-sugar epimerase
MIDLSGVDSLLITGSNGFVGRSIIDQIAKLEPQYLPHEILLVTRQGLNFDLPTNLFPITAILHQDLTQNWKFDKEVSHIINLAADGSKSPYSDTASNTFTSIVANLVSWVSRFQKSPRIFHASSGACSGFRPIDETLSPTNPKSSFVQNRLQAEYTLIKASGDYGFELSIGRLFTFSGVHLLEKSQYAIADFIKSAIASNAIKITGDPNTMRSYLHQDAMAKWLLTALICEDLHTDLEIGSSDAVTIRELAEFIAHETSAQLFFGTEPHQGDIYLPNNQATKDKLRVDEGKNWKLAVAEMINVEGKKSYGTF